MMYNDRNCVCKTINRFGNYVGGVYYVLEEKKVIPWATMKFYLIVNKILIRRGYFQRDLCAIYSIKPKCEN